MSVHTTGGGTHQVLMGVHPFFLMGGGTPSFPTGGIPILPSQVGVLPSFLMRVPPSFLTGDYLDLRSGWEGTPISGQDRGVSHPRSGWGYPHRGIPPVLTWPGMGYSPSPPVQVRNSIACTRYAVGGMPLAFMQGDFLVCIDKLYFQLELVNCVVVLCVDTFRIISLRKVSFKLSQSTIVFNHIKIVLLAWRAFIIKLSKTVADPGFPRGGGANPKGGAPTYYLANFSRKLDENEEFLDQRGGARPSRPSLDPPLKEFNRHLRL